MTENNSPEKRCSTALMIIEEIEEILNKGTTDKMLPFKLSAASGYVRNNLTEIDPLPSTSHPGRDALIGITYTVKRRAIRNGEFDKCEELQQFIDDLSFNKTD